MRFSYPFLVYSGSNFDLIFLLIYVIIVLESVEVCLAPCELSPRLTTYLTIDRLGAHGNNGYKTAKEHFPWSGNGYKKPFAAERAKLILFGTQRSWVQIPSPRPQISENRIAKPFIGCAMRYLFLCGNIS